jgi:hypothetical protein
VLWHWKNVGHRSLNVSKYRQSSPVHLYDSVPEAFLAEFFPSNNQISARQQEVDHPQLNAIGHTLEKPYRNWPNTSSVHTTYRLSTVF